MPRYGGRKRGRAIRRKRRSRRRVKKVSASRVKSIMNVAGQQWRSIRVSNRNQGYLTIQNTCMLNVVTECASLKQFHAWMDEGISSTVANTYGHQGDSALVNISTYLDPVTGDNVNRPSYAQVHDATIALVDRYRVKFKSVVMRHMFKNVDTHVCDMVVYEYVAKQSYTEAAVLGGVKLQAGLDMIAGFQRRDIDDVTSIGFGGHISNPEQGTEVHGEDQYQLTGTRIDSFDIGIEPHHSKLFAMKWRLVKKGAYRLQPNDEVLWTTKSSSFNYNPVKYLGEAGEAADINVIKGVTRIVILKLCGTVGRDTDTTVDIGYMKTDIAHLHTCETKLIPYLAPRMKLDWRQIKKSNLNLDALTAATEHAQVTE